jgi:hypothetical protein
MSFVMCLLGLPFIKDMWLFMRSFIKNVCDCMDNKVLNICKATSYCLQDYVNPFVQVTKEINTNNHCVNMFSNK